MLPYGPLVRLNAQFSCLYRPCVPTLPPWWPCSLSLSLSLLIRMMFSLCSARRTCRFVVTVTPAQRHEREAEESRRRVRTSLALLAVSAMAHLAHHAHHLMPPGIMATAMAHVPLVSASLLPPGWLDWLQAGVATAALVGPGELRCTCRTFCSKRKTLSIVGELPRGGFSDSRTWILPALLRMYLWLWCLLTLC